MQTDWLNFLTQRGALIEKGEVTGFTDQGDDSQTIFSSDTICPLSDLAIVEVSGQDAVSFLNGQFTTDITQLEEAGMQLSAWCNPKGRIISLFFIYRDKDRYFLLLPHQLKDSFCRRLQMYVLRAEVTITDKSEEMFALGIRSDDLIKLQDWQKHKHFPVADADKQRVIVFAALEQARTLWTAIESQATAIGSNIWATFNSLAGIAWITSETTESYIPQELNLDIIEGVSFSKGCYPGQEIVARIRYRGQVKKRMVLATVATDTAPTANMKIYRSGEERPVGVVISVHNYVNRDYLVLCVVELKALEFDQLHLTTHDGPALQQKALPYSLEQTH